MKIIFKKFSKLKTMYKIMFFLTSILFLFSIVYVSQGLLLLKNIETMLRIIFLILIYIGYFIYIFISILLLFSKKNKSYILNSLFVMFLSIIFIILSVYLNKTYNILDNMNKDKVMYSSSLIVLKDTNFINNEEFIVGMINDESDIEGNVLSNKLIDKKKLDKIDIKYYDNYLEMLGDLYNKTINGLFISSNYVLKYSTYDNYNSIESDTKIIYSYKEELVNEDIKLTSNKKLTEPFTILLLGVDSTKNGLQSNSVFNGDTMMMITFNPKTLNATIFSVPRDTYVPIACNGNKASKINSSAAGGTSCVINTLKNLTGIDIDYYVKINFRGVVDLVDALDGVTVDVPINFCEQDSNRDFKNEICLKKGVQTLNGEQALALSRHRKTLPMGDFQRVQHQQLVVESILNKAKNIRSVTTLFDILNVVSNNIETNINTDEILNLYNVGKSMLLNNNANVNIEKTYLTGYDLTMLIPGLGNVYTFQYYEQSLEEIINAMKINLGLKKPELTKTFNFSANYIYEVPVIGKKYFSVTRNEALPSFIDRDLNSLQNWASSRNITVNVRYIEVGMDGYDETKNNIIINQDVLKGTLVSTINTINVDVIKVNKIENNNSNTDSDINIDNKDETNIIEDNDNIIDNNGVNDNTDKNEPSNEDEIIVNENEDKETNLEE